MMRRQATAALAAVVILGVAACTGEVERALKDSRPEFMREMKAALAKSNVPFREDAEGFIRYSSRHDEAVKEARDAIEKLLSSGVAWQLDDQASREYLAGLLDSMGVKYIVEPRKDGDLIRWYPASGAQEREVGRKVAEHHASLRRQKAAK